MARSDRPVIQLDPTPGEQLLDWASLLGLVLTLAFLAASWGGLPERVPVHFGASGQPDGWGSRNTLWLFAVVPLVIHVGFGLLVRVPHIYNYPTRVTPENAERLYRQGRQLMYWLRAEMVWLFAFLCWGTVRVAQGRAQGLGDGFLYVALFVIYGTVIWFLVGMIRARGARAS